MAKGVIMFITFFNLKYLTYLILVILFYHLSQVVLFQWLEFVLSTK